MFTIQEKQQQPTNNTDELSVDDSNGRLHVESEESSMTAQGLFFYNKTIHIRPEELTFNHVAINQAYSQALTMQNTLSAPVELVLKSSNNERLELQPRQVKLQPHESITVKVTFRQPRAFPPKTVRQKETIFIKSDFFDQKVAVTVLPAQVSTASSDASSLQRALSTQRQQAFQQATSTMSRQQLSSVTVGKTVGAFKSPKNIAFDDGGVNDSFGRATASELAGGKSREPCSDEVQIVRRRQFDPFVQVSDQVEVTLAADSKTEIVSAGIGNLGSDFGDRDHIQNHQQREFESHEIALMRQQLHEIRDQNEVLRSELAKAKASHGNSEHEHQLESIRAMLRDREPKLEEVLAEAMKIERGMQKRKDAKVLEILQFKDQQITELTKALADHQIVKEQVQELAYKLKMKECELTEKTERLNQLLGNEDHFQALLQSQNKINEQSRSIGSLEEQMRQLKAENEQLRSTKVFYEESIERARAQGAILQGRLEACENELKEERRRAGHLEQSLTRVKTSVEKTSDFGDNRADTATAKALETRIQSFELENSRLKEKVFRMTDQLHNVFHTLGKVTGESQGKELLSSSQNSRVSSNDQISGHLLAEDSGFDDQLQRRAEEIVLIVEQVQAQYTLLEKEMRLLLDKGFSETKSVQTELSRSDIEDMQVHFAKLQEQLRMRQGDHDELLETRKKLAQMQEELFRSKGGVWPDFGSSSNENLQSNRMLGQERRASFSVVGQNDILVSERFKQANNLSNNANRMTLSSVSTLQPQISGMSQLAGGNQSKLFQEMQEREQQLLDQISILKEQMRFQTSHSEVNTQGDASAFAQEHLSLRVGELETLVFQQREQILQLQDHSANLKRQLEDQIEENTHKLELYELRNHNLSELNRKYQEVSQGQYQSAQYMSGDIGYLNTHASANQVTSPDYKPSAVETERVKQYAQQQEMKVMDLEHALKEAKVSLKHAISGKSELQGRLQKLELDLARFTQDSQLSKAGINIFDSKLAILVNELKAKIRRLEAEKPKVTAAPESASLGLEAISGSSLYALREEYCTKLEKLVEQNAQERSELLSKSLGLKTKVEALNSQLKTMEEKEIRLFSQLEDVRGQRAYEEEQLMTKLQDLSSVNDQKQQVCAELEKEVKQKDKLLSERQEQLSILLSAMEQQALADGVSPLGEARQKLANLAAECCTLKAVEAQLERKCADLAHSETQALIRLEKAEKDLGDSQTAVASLQRKVRTLESTNELLERQRQDLGNRVQEVERDKADNHYKLERLQFQLKTKEETIACLKTQGANAELHFKEQIERVRDDMSLRFQRARSCGGSADNASRCHLTEHRPSRQVGLKIAIQQIHIVIADYIERVGGRAIESQNSVELAQKNIIAEMEKALGVAQTTIERLEADLERERHKSGQLENEWDAMALNGILVTRQEKMTAQLKSIGRLLEERELQSNDGHRQQLESLNKIVRAQEVKLDNEAKMIAQLDEEILSLKIANKRLLAEKDELQSAVLCNAQEQHAFKAMLEKKAQISVDDRHRQRIESLQTFFQDGIAKLLSDGGSEVDRIQSMGRQLASAQLIIDKQQRLIDALGSERDGLDSTVHFLKATKEDLEAKLRDQMLKVAADQARLESYESGAMTNNVVNKRKQECLNLEKELIKEREAFELKSREVTSLLHRLESKKLEQMQKQLGSDLDALVRRKKESCADVSQAKIQALQEQLMEVRGCHLQELEELKVQCDLEVAEARRELSHQQSQFEAKFMPGTAPGDILDQNHELREQLAKLQVEVDSLYLESDQMRHQLYEKDKQIEFLAAELNDKEIAFDELEHAAFAGRRSSNTYQHPLRSALKRASSQGRGNAIETAASDAAIKTPGVTGSSESGVLPPFIHELFAAKRSELLAKQKLRLQLQTEVKLRQQLTNKLSQDLQQQRVQLSVSRGENHPESTFVVGEDIVGQLMAQNANVLSILQDPVCLLTPDLTAQEETQHWTNEGDFQLLIKAVIYFANQMALKTVSEDNGPVNHSLLQKIPFQAVIEAQRVVIRALSQRHTAERVKYSPETAIDRKVWYLELLEEQVADCESQTNKLQDFVKRLQIGVSGSLHSAAEIKASSLDLAQHLKKASEEVKVLRSVTGLIMHDVKNLHVQEGQKRELSSCLDGFNPFLTGGGNHMKLGRSVEGELQSQHLLQTQRSNMDKLLNEHDSVQNQLNLTSKIKQSLEFELVQSKLAHASELQTVIQRMSDTERKLHELSQAKQQLLLERKAKEDQVQSQVSEIDDLKKKLGEMEKSVLQAKQELAKANSSSKHWQKMQTDMQDWRKSHEESLRSKQKQVNEALEKVSKLKNEKRKIKAEVQMLRQSQKENRDSSLLDRLKSENSQLVARFNEQLDERKKEIEFWVEERAIMRDKIDQLESANALIAPGAMFNQTADDNDAGQTEQVQRLGKKLRQKETECKQLKSDLLQSKNSLQKAELKMVKLEAQVRDANTNVAETQNKITLLTNRTKELEIEKEMLIQRQRDQIKAQDLGQDQINFELDKLREEFARVKVQKEGLEMQTEGAAEREKQWRDNIERLNRETFTLSNALAQKEAELTETKSVNEKKVSSLLSDLRFMRDENQRLHAKIKEANESVLTLEAQIQHAVQEHSEQELAKDSLKRRLLDKAEEQRSRDLRIAELQAALQTAESAHFSRVKLLQKDLSDLKLESSQTCQLLETQIEHLKAKLVSERKASAKEVDQTLALTQKETLLKHFKKDLASTKAQVAKFKQKNKELKTQLDQIPQRQAKGAFQVKPIGGKQRANETSPATEQVVANKQAEADDFENLLKEARLVNELETKVAEGQLQIGKVENWNYALSKQLDEAKSMLVQAEEKITELLKEKKELTKTKLSTTNSTEKALKDQIKVLAQELEKIKEEWTSPQNAAAQMETILQLQSQVKQLQSELSRKAKHLGQVKQSKEQTSKEQTQTQTEVVSLREEIARLKLQLKDAQKSDKACKDLRSQVDWLTKAEKRLKEEMLSLNEKLKATRGELARKDQHLKEYKDRMDMIQSEVTDKSSAESELNKLREVNRKQRVDLEIKENQVRTLRNRLEQNHNEIQALSDEKLSYLKQDSELEAKLKQQKIKARRFENNLQKSINALKKIGIELAAVRQTRQDSASSSARFGHSPSGRQPIRIYKRDSSSAAAKHGPIDVDDLAKDAAYYREGVEILGLSMNEMEMFINPSVQQRSCSPSSVISSRGLQVSKNQSNARLLDCLQRLDAKSAAQQIEPREIEEIGEFCVQLLGDITSTV